MGGTALLEKTGIESQRLTLEEFDRVNKEVTKVLDDLGIKWLEVPYIREKTDFGDIDIIVIDERTQLSKEFDNKGPLAIISENLDKFGITDFLFINNNPYGSILYESKYQVDFIVADKECAVYNQNYLSYNDLGNLMGRAIKRFGLTHGHDGLFYDHYNSDRSYRERILVSTDQNKIFEILMLDANKFYNGFDTYTDMFDFLIESPLFSAQVYQYDKLNNRNRVRDKKRKVYNMFLDYIKDIDTEPTETVDRDLLFPWVSKYINHSYNKHLVKEQIRLAVPGKVVMTHTSYSGRALGYLINKVKEAYGTSLIDASPEELVRLIDLQVAAHKHILDTMDK